MGFVSEDGVPYGSINVNELDEIEPKTDEARAELDRLKAQSQQANEEADANAEASLEAVRNEAKPVPEDKGTTTQSSPIGEPPAEKSAPKKASEKAPDKDN